MGEYGNNWNSFCDIIRIRIKWEKLDIIYHTLISHIYWLWVMLLQVTEKTCKNKSQWPLKSHQSDEIMQKLNILLLFYKTELISCSKVRVYCSILQGLFSFLTRCLVNFILKIDYTTWLIAVIAFLVLSKEIAFIILIKSWLVFNTVSLVECCIINFKTETCFANY